MGIYHFMGLGQAVGTVTCAVDYIEKALDTLLNKPAEETKRLFAGSGGISHSEQNIGKIEALVLFTSQEVICKKLKAFKYTGCSEPVAVRDEVVRQLKKVWKRRPKIGAKVFWCEVDINDYQDCFNKAVNVAYRFSPPDKQGKEIWCNMTGGTNSIQLALLSMARLTGASTKHYLISQKPGYREEISVPSSVKIAPNKDGCLNTLPFVKFSLDSLEFYDILKELAEPNLVEQPISNSDLLSRLKNKQRFMDCSVEEFIDRYLLKLYALGYTERCPEDRVDITEDGYSFLVDDLSRLEEQLRNPSRNIVDESKNWEWFTEETL